MHIRLYVLLPQGITIGYWVQRHPPDSWAPLEFSEAQSGACGEVNSEIEEEAANSGDDHEGRHREPLEVERRHAVDGA